MRSRTVSVSNLTAGICAEQNELAEKPPLPLGIHVVHCCSFKERRFTKTDLQISNTTSQNYLLDDSFGLRKLLPVMSAVVHFCFVERQVLEGRRTLLQSVALRAFRPN